MAAAVLQRAGQRHPRSAQLLLKGMHEGSDPSAALQHHSPAVVLALFESLFRKVFHGYPSAGGIWGVPVSLVLSGLWKDCFEQHVTFITN